MSGLSNIISRQIVRDACRLGCNITQVRASSSSAKQRYCCNYEDVKSAMRAIKPYIHRTGMFSSSYFNDLAGRKMVFKGENLQKTGSFKIRGATNAILKLKEKSVKPTCVLTHSSGNHGQALAKAARILNIPCYVVMPESSSFCKVEAVREYGGKVVFCPSTQKGRSEVGARIIKEHSGVFIHPSQNPDVIAGQGTIGIEILEQDRYVDTIVVPVGGGGMISGIAIAAKAINPAVKIIAAEPDTANDCEISKQKGELTQMTDYSSTVADGARVNIDTLTWPIIRDLVDDVITVSDDEIKSATRQVWERLKLVIEPTSGVAVAAVLSKKFSRIEGKHVAVVLCGGNIDLSSFMLYCV
ncbi:serine racemase-like [Styela clava]